MKPTARTYGDVVLPHRLIRARRDWTGNLNGHQELYVHGWDPNDDRYHQSPDCKSEEDKMIVSVGGA